MDIENALNRIPIVARVYRAFANPTKAALTRSRLRQLGDNPYPQGMQLRAAFERLRQTLPPEERRWISKIEDERRRLLTQDRALVDGSFDEGGLYDGDNTIRQACLASKAPGPALLLYLLVRALRPRRVLELGTNVGISSAYMAAALQVNSDDGTVTTLDASPYRQRLAREVHGKLGLDNVDCVRGLFADTLGGVLASTAPIDLAFIDGHHQYQPTLDYFSQIFPAAGQEAAFVFDDIRWSDGMKKAWSEIRADERLGLVVDLSTVGIGIRRQGGSPERYVLPPMYLV